METNDNLAQSSEADNEVQFDQDLVEAFLEMDSVHELMNYIQEMDRSRFKEIGYVLFQVFSQRNDYTEIHEYFKTDSDALDFDNVLRIVTELLLCSTKYKKISRYVRIQLWYSLSLVKSQNEEFKLSEESRQYVDSIWRQLKPDCIRQYTEIIEFELTREMVEDLIKNYEASKRNLNILELVHEFEIYDIDLNWEDSIAALIDSEKFPELQRLLEVKTEFINFAIGKMSNNKLAKKASSLIEKLDLDIRDFPLVLERLQKITIRYYVYNYVKGPKSHDYLPLWKIEDIFSGYNSLLVYICEDLAFKEKENFQREAKALALRNSLYNQLREDTREKLDVFELTDDEMKIGSMDDKFAPLSEPSDQYFTLPDNTKVVFIGSDEEVKLAEPLLVSTHLGVDCEWRPQLVKFNRTGVALLQIGDKDNIFLIDMKALWSSKPLDELLTKIFNNPETNIIGMSFHNDLSALASGCPNLGFYKAIENLYDVQPMYSSIYKEQKGLGLSKIVDKVIGRKVCKVEQMGNWERRPLRQSQMHYAALDSYILVELFESMKSYAQDNDIVIEEYWNTYTHNELTTGSESEAKVNFHLHNQNIGTSIVKINRLKAGEHLLPNTALNESKVRDSYNFLIDYNLNKLNKLLISKNHDTGGNFVKSNIWFY